VKQAQSRVNKRRLQTLGFYAFAPLSGVRCAKRRQDPVTRGLTPCILSRGAHRAEPGQPHTVKNLSELPADPEMFLTAIIFTDSYCSRLVLSFDISIPERSIFKDVAVRVDGALILEGLEIVVVGTHAVYSS